MARRNIIAIGGSFGAIEVLKRICRNLPRDLDASVLVAVHLAEESPGAVARMIGEGASLPSSMAMDEEHLAPGHIYVAPAGYHLLLMGSTLRLGRGPRENMARPAIDPLFRSVAMSAGPRAIG